jgi:hypothetical protein
LAQAVGAPWLYPICLMLIVLSSALVEGLLVTFTTIYDARLFAALTDMKEQKHM